MRYLFVFLLVAVVGCPQQRPPRVTKPSFDPIPLPGFSLTERSGETVTKDDLKGKVWVASFIFTRCSGPCPRVTRTMARLQDQFANEPNARLVTFTVDPEYDTPEVLTRYARQEDVQADPERWLFLTGDEEEIQRVITEGFAIHREEMPDAQAGESVDHGTKLAVVDQNGMIRGYFDGFDATGSPEEFEKEIGELRATVMGLLNANRR